MTIKQHAGASGIRVNVLKPSIASRTADNMKHDWTSVYVGSNYLVKMLRHAGGDLGRVTQAVRLAALTADPARFGGKFSRAVCENALTLLTKTAKRVRAEDRARFAAENNAAWEQVQ